MRRVLTILFVLGGTLSAQQLPKTMTKMEVILQGTDVPEGSFATKPKIMYRAGTQYCRIEETADEEHNIHGVVIIHEPDVWMVNLATKTAQHGTDPGPTFNCRLPVFATPKMNLPEDEAKQISALEFGGEMEFFQKHGATAHPGGVLQTKETTVYKLQFGDSSLGLFTYGTPERPLAVAWSRGDQHEIFWFSGYGEMEFDSKLFAKPDHVTIEGAKPQ